MSNAGLLLGITGVTQGHGLDIKPYVAATSFDAPGSTPPTSLETTGDVGVDLFYNLTPDLRANLTVNTDFAQTEVDQRLVNLTRFPLFFPEKRDFFLDGSTFLNFYLPRNQQNSVAVQPFFSRRIGRCSAEDRHRDEADRSDRRAGCRVSARAHWRGHRYRR